MLLVTLYLFSITAWEPAGLVYYFFEAFQINKQSDWFSHY